MQIIIIIIIINIFELEIFNAVVHDHQIGKLTEIITFQLAWIRNKIVLKPTLRNRHQHDFLCYGQCAQRLFLVTTRITTGTSTGRAIGHGMISIFRTLP